MRTALLILSVASLSICFIACKGDENQNGTDQNAPNTLASLINPNANSATATSTTTGSASINDIWVLAAINSKEKYDVNFVNNTPVIDLDSAKKSMSGHTGCNSLSSKLKMAGNKLIFDNLKLTSSQPCNDKGFEKKLMSSFKSGNTTYKISNDSLYLNVGAGAEFIYRRIRRV